MRFQVDMYTYTYLAEYAHVTLGGGVTVMYVTNSPEVDAFTAKDADRVPNLTNSIWSVLVMLRPVTVTATG